ncbi:hypothetical protein HFN63_37085 [Rhizobium leguminosarum]|nr:hypothetical protein [Rhizobium leguminosarum]
MLETEASLEVVRHHVDGSGVSDLVSPFVICSASPSCRAFPISTGAGLYAFKQTKHYGKMSSASARLR